MKIYLFMLSWLSPCSLIAQQNNHHDLIRLLQVKIGEAFSEHTYLIEIKSVDDSTFIFMNKLDVYDNTLETIKYPITTASYVRFKEKVIPLQLHNFKDCSNPNQTDGIYVDVFYANTVHQSGKFSLVFPEAGKEQHYICFVRNFFKFLEVNVSDQEFLDFLQRLHLYYLD